MTQGRTKKALDNAECVEFTKHPGVRGIVVPIAMI